MKLSWLIGTTALGLVLYSMQPAKASVIVNGAIDITPLWHAQYFDFTNLDWSFSEIQSGVTLVLPCPLVPWANAEYAIWQQEQTPPPVVIDYPPPPVITPPPCVGCGSGPMPSPVPEASTWLMLLLGFTSIGFSIFQRRLTTVSIID